MRRPFFWPALGLGLGVLASRAFFVPKTPLLFFILFLLPFLWAFRGKKLFLGLFLLSFMTAGMLRAELVSELPRHHVFHLAQGEWVSLEGRLDSLPEVKERGKRKVYSFILEAENLVSRKDFFRLTGKVQIFLFNPQEVPAYGNRVRLWGKLALPKVPQNPGEFNYREYLAQQGIYAIFEGYGERTLRILKKERGIFEWPLVGLQRLRELSARRLDQTFSPPLNGLVKALLLGIRKGLSETLRDDFVKTGTTHLVAISGMNITLVAGTLFFLALALGFPQKGAAVMGFFSALAYVFLSGAGIPVIRAGWMAGLFFIGILLERERDLLNGLFFAFFAILAFDPHALFQAGFQLSFLSVFFLALLAGWREIDWPHDLIQTGWILLGTFPLCAAYFSVFSWTSLFANLLAIPLFHLGVLGGLVSLFGSQIPFVGPVLVWISSLCLKGGLAWIHLWAEQSWGYFHLRPPSRTLMISYYVALGLVYGSHKLKNARVSLLKTFSVSCWILVTALFFLPAKGEKFVLTLFSAGQNELLHVEFPHRHHWMVNAGRGAPSDQARWILSPFLRQSGVKQLKGILLTDSARRHTGGLPTLLDNFSVRSLLFPLGGKFDLRQRVERIPLRRGDYVRIEGEGGFQILDVVEEKVFLLIDAGERKFLFLPTWKGEVLQRALPRLKNVPSVDVILFPAWGEPSVTMVRELASALSPQWAVFSKRKPALELLLTSLKETGTSPLFLSETGALRFEAQGKELRVMPYLGTGLRGE